jgi:hypothetical protein
MFTYLMWSVGGWCGQLVRKFIHEIFMGILMTPAFDVFYATIWIRMKSVFGYFRGAFSRKPQVTPEPNMPELAAETAVAS